MGSVNVAIVGVGNCASALVQGLEYYRDADPQARVPGLLTPELGGYHVADLEVACAFDVDERKVGRDVGEAIFADPNTAFEALDEAPELGAPVYRGPELDARTELMDEHDEADAFVVSDDEPVDPAAKLDAHDVDVLVNLLPAGSREATEAWMEAALEAGTAVANCPPVFVASDPSWAKRFEDAGLPVLGDDVATQVGPTATHRVLSSLFEDRGVDVGETYQLNVAGNTDALTLQDASRLEGKRESTRRAVQSSLEEPMDDQDVKVGPSDYVPFLDDNKVSFIRMQGRGFLDAPVELELRLSVENSANSAGVALDAIRCAALARDRGLAGAVEDASGALFQRPPTPLGDEEARRRLRSFVEGSEGG